MAPSTVVGEDAQGLRVDHRFALVDVRQGDGHVGQVEAGQQPEGHGEQDQQADGLRSTLFGLETARKRS